MKLVNAFVLLGVAALAACGGRPEGQVTPVGDVPYVGLKKDTRAVVTSCSSCNQELEAGTERCPNKKCGARLHWSDTYTCPFCKGSKDCQACLMMEQMPDGKCYNCKGQGYLTYIGQSRPCPNCAAREKGKCPSCKGTTKCDFCAGQGSLAVDTLKEKRRKPEGEAAEPAMPEKK